MNDEILRLEKDSQGKFCIPLQNCVEQDGVISYKKPLFVDKADWSKFMGMTASIISKVNKNNKCLVFATSMKAGHNMNLEKVY